MHKSYIGIVQLLYFKTLHIFATYNFNFYLVHETMHETLREIFPTTHNFKTLHWLIWRTVKFGEKLYSIVPRFQNICTRNKRVRERDNCEIVHFVILWPKTWAIKKLRKGVGNLLLQPNLTNFWLWSANKNGICRQVGGRYLGSHT